MKCYLFILLTMISGIVNAQDFFLFAGTYTNTGESKGLYVYNFNAKTGDYRLEGTATAENPSYLTLDKEGRYLFAVGETNGAKPGDVRMFSFTRENSKLQFINKRPSGGDDPCYIAIDESSKWVVAGNYTGGNFSVFPVQQDGGLGLPVQLIQHSGHSVNAARQDRAYVHSTVFTPDQRYLAVTDLGLDQIAIYGFDASKDKPVSENPKIVHTAPGSGPRHITFHQTLPYAYTIEEMAGNVSAYGYKDGELTHFQTLNSYPAGFKEEMGSAAIHLSPDGKFLYASNRDGSNTISIYSIDQTTGRLTAKGLQKTLGEIPRDFTIDPTGNFLLAANSKTNNIVIFKRNKKTGLLKATGKVISIPQAVCLKMLAR